MSTPVAKIDNVYYGDLQNAIEAADENDTVKIIKEYNDVLPNEIKKSINIESEDDISVTFK
nr:hypothetical protein [bacterium]